MSNGVLVGLLASFFFLLSFTLNFNLVSAQIFGSELIPNNNFAIRNSSNSSIADGWFGCGYWLNCLADDLDYIFNDLVIEGQGVNITNGERLFVSTSFNLSNLVDFYNQTLNLNITKPLQLKFLWKPFNLNATTVDCLDGNCGQMFFSFNPTTNEPFSYVQIFTFNQTHLGFNPDARSGDLEIHNGEFSSIQLPNGFNETTLNFRFGINSINLAVGLIDNVSLSFIMITPTGSQENDASFILNNTSLREFTPAIPLPAKPTSAERFQGFVSNVTNAGTLIFISFTIFVGAISFAVKLGLIEQEKINRVLFLALLVIGVLFAIAIVGVFL